ncbi:hypothetical protein [Streptomyces asiaticus]|uniref:hypothetical protein n=1 Tax=Streptomyces asiaticus TaxID=114695 RepID=UPI003F6752D8
MIFWSAPCSVCCRRPDRENSPCGWYEVPEKPWTGSAPIALPSRWPSKNLSTDISWEEEGLDQPGARTARAAAAKLVQASRIRGYDDAEEQARIGLIDQARDLILQVAE